MTLPIIEFEGLGKKYQLGAHKEPYLSLRDSFSRTTKKFAQKLTRFSPFTTHHPSLTTPEDFWALKDVSFSVQEGEAIGIIGRNGAGKSTLLKVLSRITPPTEGRITLCGRVASLLEVGTGFHPELTGRENIFLNGAILGMTRAEIRKKFDEIVAFAEVGKFLDTPVKRYSSGMYVRLAFAVAAHLEPEILVVDEVLAVGDAEFQRKCLGKMSEVAKGGRTVLFVSHNMAAVETLCTRAILLQNGFVIESGAVREVIQRYFNVFESASQIPLSARTDREGDGSIRLTSIQLNGPNSSGQSSILTGSEMVIFIGYEMQRPVSGPVFHIAIFDDLGIQVIHMDTSMAGYYCETIQKHGKMLCRIPRLPLPSGKYRMNVAVMRENRYIDRIEGASVFDVTDGAFFNSPDTSSYRAGKCLVEHGWSQEVT